MAEHKSYKCFVKCDSPYLGEWDLNGKDLVLTIKDVKLGEVTGEKGRIDRGMVIYFSENVKPLFCNKTNGDTIARLYGDLVDAWVGKKVQLYPVDGIKLGVKTVKGIRVRPIVPTSNVVEYHCEVCGKVISENTYQKSVEKYGKAYCSAECLNTDQNGKDIL